ncbi:Mucin-4 [Branchiostoma belcheri]|nr:Mucin-4 [Branchiostoma belcheri]
MSLSSPEENPPQPRVDYKRWKTATDTPQAYLNGPDTEFGSGEGVTWVLPERCPKSERILLPSGKVYWAESRAATYEKAQATCRLKGGMIAVPTDKFENSALVWLKNCVDRFRPFWLGLRREEDNQTAAHRWVHAFGAVPLASNIMITWPGGRPFSAWAAGEPDVEKDRRCVRVVSGSQNGSRRDKWADASCSSRHRYVCEKFTDPECSQYQVLMEGSRSVKVENRRPSRRCDNLGYHRWYRFMGEAGTAMPTEPPPSSHRCGSDAPVWLNGTNPAYEDGVVERQVCARVSGNICRWKWKIHVKACPGGYLIYKLPPIKLKRCRSTYCGLGNNVTIKDVVTIISKKDEDASEGFYKEGKVSNDTPLHVQGCSSYEELSEAWRSAHVWTYPGHDQHFKCDGRHTAVNGSWYRFTGVTRRIEYLECSIQKVVAVSAMLFLTEIRTTWGFRGTRLRICFRVTPGVTLSSTLSDDVE